MHETVLKPKLRITHHTFRIDHASLEDHMVCIFFFYQDFSPDNFVALPFYVLS